MSSRAFSANSGQLEAGSTTTASSFLPSNPPFLFCSSISISITSFRQDRKGCASTAASRNGLKHLADSGVGTGLHTVPEFSIAHFLGLGVGFLGSDLARNPNWLLREPCALSHSFAPSRKNAIDAP